MCTRKREGGLGFRRLNILSARQEVTVSWFRKTVNRAAHVLAKVGVIEECCEVWPFDPPERFLVNKALISL